jgi:catechol 2,3-dioxygenase-like lactoylglutathione lyase family enzyme
MSPAALGIGVVALGVTDVRRAAEFWSAALGYKLREDGFGGWAKVLVPPDGAGTAIALQLSPTPPPDHPRLHFDLHVADASEQEAEAGRLVSLGARRGGGYGFRLVVAFEVAGVVGVMLRRSAPSTSTGITRTPR